MYVDTKEDAGQQPSLKQLAHVLRHRELWPTGFEWDYRYHTNCAIGLCCRLYDMNPSNLDEFNLDYDGSSNNKIFNTPASWFRHPLTLHSERMRMITPEIVADRIDNYLGKKHVEVREVELDFTGRPF